MKSALMKHLKIMVCLGILFAMYGCSQQNKINPQVYTCIVNAPAYVERCKLKAIKSSSERAEIEYYFQHVGKYKFEKEIYDYSKSYIKSAELYCAMNSSFSFITPPTNKNAIYEKTAECLILQYQQLGQNLRLLTNTATETIIKRVLE